MSTSILSELLLLLAVATAGLLVFERLRLPSIAGFLVVGALVGPGGLAFLDDPGRVRELAELGVVLLLFGIGLELPLERIQRLWRPALVAGGLQVSLTLGSVALLALGLGLEAGPAIVLGALVAMSSTALVMRLLSERGEIDAPHGQLAMGILLFQDLCVVPILLAVPFLAAGSDARPDRLALEIGRSLAALAVFAGVARFALPRLLDRAMLVRSRELFTMVAFLAVMGSAVIAQRIGLTLSVGAFIGGLVLSASPYSHQLFAEVVPLRGVLLGTFFTAVGMLFDPAVALAQWPGVLAYTGGVVFLKAGFVAAIVALVLRQGLRLGVVTGLALAQTGEFSFVLAGAAASAGLLDAKLGGVFVAGSIATLVATPFLIGAAPRIASWLARGATRLEAAAPGARAMVENHVVFVGFGLTGQNLGRVLRAREIPYRAVEANAVAVRDLRRRGEPVVYGDATRLSILESVGVRRARAVVVAISDPIATREVVSLARSLAPAVPILVRTHFVRDRELLVKSGATRVVVEELESTLEMVGALLEHFGVPAETIARFVDELRDEGYVFLRSPETILDPWLAELLEGVASQWVEVPDGFVGEASIGALEVRRRTGAAVVAVDRGGATTASPGAAFAVRAGDRLLAIGASESIERLRKLVESA